jgi:hypothetical protein
MSELTTFGISVFIIIGPAQNGSRSPNPAQALGTILLRRNFWRCGGLNAPRHLGIANPFLHSAFKKRQVPSSPRFCGSNT